MTGMPRTTTPRRLGSAPIGRLATASYGHLVAALVLVWGVGDVGSTGLAAAATGSTALELNPLMRLLLQVEPLLVPLVKAAVVLAVAVALHGFRDAVEGLPGWRAWFLSMVGVGSLVICNNLAVAVAALV